MRVETSRAERRPDGDPRPATRGGPARADGRAPRASDGGQCAGDGGRCVGDGGPCAGDGDLGVGGSVAGQGGSVAGWGRRLRGVAGAAVRGGSLRAAMVWGGLLAAALALALLLAPPLGTDLSAQVARADFARQYGVLTPVDLRWYGGTSQHAYSWVSPAVMAVLGARVTGAVSLVASTLALAVLLSRGGARRPVFATLLGAVAFAGNLVSGRVTFALGIAFGLWGLAALTLTDRRRRLGLAAVGTLLASATSPPAGLFLGLAGGALTLAGLLVAWRPNAAYPGGPRTSGSGTGGQLARRPWLGMPLDGVTVAVAAAVPIGLNAIISGTSGVMNISSDDATRAVVTGLATALLVRVPVLRVGALLAALMVYGAYVVPSPIGLNATRLAIVFVLPVLGGFAEPERWLGWLRRLRVRRPGAGRSEARWPAGFGGQALRAGSAAAALVAVLAAAVYWQPPVLTLDLRDAGNPTARRAYFAPLIAELDRRQPVGRVEVPPTRDYWEAAYVADAVPLARGWLRQTDMARNELFFVEGKDQLDPEEYRSWLVDNGVEYVALPDAKPSWVGRKEAELVASRPGYLREVWRDRHWTLFAVDGQPSIVDGAKLVSSDGATVTFDADAPGEVLVRVAPSTWLRVREVALAVPAASCAPPRLTERGRWVAVRVACPGRYSVTS